MQIQHVVEQGGRVPVYGTILRAPKLQLAVKLTDAGRMMAVPLYQIEHGAETGRYRHAEIRRLPLDQDAAGEAVEMQLGDVRH